MRVLAFLLALLALAGCARPMPEGVTELTYATPYRPQHPFSRADKIWMDEVARRSNGRLIIRPLWSGAVLSSDMSMQELRYGVADIGLITPIYVRGGTHLIRAQSGFYSGVESISAQVALYRCMARSSPQFARELSGLKVLAVQGGTLPGIVTRDRPVRTLTDLKGLRLRAPTELIRVLEVLGADPVNMPMGEVYSAMAKGVIDGVVAPGDTFRSLHFAEVAKHYNTIAIPRGAYPARAMGIAKWNMLTKDDQALLEATTSVWESAIDREVMQALDRGMQEARSRKVAIVDMSSEEQARFDAAYLREAEANARALSELGIDGLSVFKTARAAVKGRDMVECGAPQ